MNVIILKSKDLANIQKSCKLCFFLFNTKHPPLLGPVFRGSFFGVWREWVWRVLDRWGWRRWCPNARLTKLNARQRKARSCLTFAASSDTVATLPDFNISRYWKHCITAFCGGNMVSGSSSASSCSGWCFASRIFVLWLTFYIFVETVSCLNFSVRLIDCKLVKKRKVKKWLIK